MGVEKLADDSIEAAVERYRLAIPRPLQLLKIWLVWQFQAADAPGGKALKVPYYAGSGQRRRGIQGAPEDVAQLVTFDEALAAFATGRWAGLGIAHVPGTGLNSWDFDNCIDKAGAIDPDLEPLLHDAGTYVEISPSGSGIRMICLGTLPSIKRIHPEGFNIECFGESGFVTITARVLCGDTIAALAPAVAATLKEWIKADDAPTQRSRTQQLDGVRATDPVYRTLATSGRIKAEYGDGRISIVCPFEATHTSGSSRSDTVYFLPNTHGFAQGHFRCLHAHCADKTDGDFSAAIGVPTVDLSGLLGSKEDSPIVDAARFMADWTPTEYVLKGILIRGYLHALTGHSNAGKTAIALKMAICVAMGLPFGNHPTTRARVVYLAGENPDDVRSRVIALCQDMKIDPDELAQWFFVLPRAYSLDEHRQATIDAIAKLGPVGMVVIDTRAAYAGAEDENDNAQTMADAQAARALTALPGRPCVLVPNHPPHGATAPNMRPRGGSSYYGEIDINFNVSNDGAGGVTLIGEKMRGAAHFEPITMALRIYTLLGYTQPDGDSVTAVVVDVTTPEQADEIAAETESDENRLLVIMAHDTDGGLREWAAQMGWPNGKMRVSRLLAALADDKLVRRYRRRWVLTNAGEKEGAAAIARGLKNGKRSKKDVSHDD